MAQAARRGTSWVSVVLGWLAALGAALILSSIVGAIVGALFAALGAESGTTGGGISGLIGVLLTLLIAFYLGGYAAGRMASRSGVKHGLLVALLALVVTIVLALIGAAVGASFIDQLGGVTLPGPASKAAQNVPQQGVSTILSLSAVTPPRRAGRQRVSWCFLRQHSASAGYIASVECVRPLPRDSLQNATPGRGLVRVA
jgi:MFS family permease